MSARFGLLVVTKAPVVGAVKTRLCPPATPAQAADLAAAALLDTLTAVLATAGAVPIVAMTGELSAAARRDELAVALGEVTVVPQRGNDFAQRLAHAHADAESHAPRMPLLQIGMDTPQVTPELLGGAARSLCEPGTDAVLGQATDGGWWALGLREPRHAAVLTQVAMSRPDTGERTHAALHAAELRTATLPALTDVDTMADAEAVAAHSAQGRFADAVATVTRVAAS